MTSNKWIVFAFFIFILFLIGSAVYFFYPFKKSPVAPAAPGSNIEDTAAPADSESYVNSQFGFSLKPPAGFSADEVQDDTGRMSVLLTRADGLMLSVIADNRGAEAAVYGSYKWTSGAVAALKDLQDGQSTVFKYQTLTKASDFSIGDYKGVKYETTPIEKSSVKSGRTYDIALIKDNRSYFFSIPLEESDILNQTVATFKP